MCSIYLNKVLEIKITFSSRYYAAGTTALCFWSLKRHTSACVFNGKGFEDNRYFHLSANTLMLKIPRWRLLLFWFDEGNTFKYHAFFSVFALVLSPNYPSLTSHFGQRGSRHLEDCIIYGTCQQLYWLPFFSSLCYFSNPMAAQQVQSPMVGA